MQQTETTKKLYEALKEADRFTRSVRAYLDRLKEDPLCKYGCKESGAMRRASMDLSRALVKVRRG